MSPGVLNCPLRFNIDSHFLTSKLALIFQRTELPAGWDKSLMAASRIAIKVGSSGMDWGEERLRSSDPWRQRGELFLQEAAALLNLNRIETIARLSEMGVKGSI